MSCLVGTTLGLIFSGNVLRMILIYVSPGCEVLGNASVLFAGASVCIK